ncbi:tannase/feruloyl esterase family alpha/beta hydrolase [Granulicella arctica]|uniref:tannase/feruloyl esterase family alpha/beta hydrolase n=1 Tax=Granulicella arctica TaxID=940613 RepID=UPI0021DF9957|nr:tannase/feruloyl esterase family alpha/beta hydrolase [Granulicella arctica]
MHKLLIAFAILTAAAQAQKPEACTNLLHLTIPNTRILTAEPIDPAQALPGDIPAAAKVVPPFCRVTAQLTPSADSDIRMEIWLPLTWNGLFRGQGNGGFAGAIDRNGLARAANQGYATAATDTGHTGSATDATWALHHPEKVIDFGYRAIHEMTVTSQAILQSFYGTPAKHTFFAACSDGGREALMEAQRFPADYDGIIAGAPAYNWTALLTNSLASAKAFTLTPASYIPAEKLPAISAAVLNACDANDGLKDGILNDPRTCHFDPNKLLCKKANGNACLTRPQIKTLQALYAGAHAADGSPIEPGYLPGAETGPGGWTDWITGKALGQAGIFSYGQGFFANMVYSDPAWDFKAVTVDAAYQKAQQLGAPAINATDPNLTPFFTRGGKLILYHGWNDPAIPATGTIDYVTQMTAATPEANASTRLYMVPGMQHCAGGPGATSFGQFGWFPSATPDDPQHDISLALEQWVQTSTPPETLIATHYEAAPGTSPPTLTRPLCAYPQSAKYNGTGDPNTAASFTCSQAK